MKAPNKGNRPIPILMEDGGDYTNGSHFKTKVEIVSVPKSNDKPIYKYSISLDLFCPPLEKMIAEGRAKIVICLEQDTTRKFQDYAEGMTIEIDASTLRLDSKLEVTPLIIANGKTELSYDAQYMETIYGLFSDNIFTLEKCQILGYGHVVLIKTNAVRGLSQIVAIQELTKRDGTHPYLIELNNPKIIIKANSEITKNIKLIQANSNTLEGLVNSSLAYPVFFYVIEIMVTDPDAYSSWRWFNAIVSKINSVRSQKGQSEFDPYSFIGEHGSSSTWHDEIWTLVSQLLTDNNGQLMLLGFEKAGKFAEGQ